MKSATDIHGSQRMNPNDFGDPLIFYLRPSAGQRFTYPVIYLNIYTMDWQENFADVRGFQRMNPNDFTSSTIIRSTFKFFQYLKV